MARFPVPGEAAMTNPGFLGKLPSRGDFVDRGVDPATRREWSDWLDESVAVWRDATGDQWLTWYLEMPIWRFALAGAGSPISGVLMPSEDKVGREHPLVILGPAIVDRDAGWFDAAIDAALAALSNGQDPEVFAQRVAELGPPPARAESEGGRWWTDGGPHVAAGDWLNRDGLPRPGATIGLLTGKFVSPDWTALVPA